MYTIDVILMPKWLDIKCTLCYLKHINLWMTFPYFWMSFNVFKFFFSICIKYFQWYSTKKNIISHAQTYTFENLIISTTLAMYELYKLRRKFILLWNWLLNSFTIFDYFNIIGEKFCCFRKCPTMIYRLEFIAAVTRTRASILIMCSV